jgi:hypothetical protein
MGKVLSLLEQVKSMGFEQIGKAEAYLEKLIGVDINGEFLLLCGLGAVILLITLWLAVLAVKKFIPKYI